MATVTRPPLYCGSLAERPIIRVVLPGETVDEFQRSAAAALTREFFVELDTPVGELVRIEAPFKSGAIGVRAEAITKSAIRQGRSGVLVRLTKLEPGSYGVSIPPTSTTWPRPEEVTEVRRKVEGPAIARTTTPRPAVARTGTAHVVRRSPSVIEVEAELPTDDDPVAEFSGPAASITKSSPVSADLAKQLNERPTPPPAPRTPAIIRRATPPVGVPVLPKPIERKIETPPSTPPIDDDWTVDSPTLGPRPSPLAASSKPTPPAFPALEPKPTPTSIPAVTASPATPPKGVPSIGARPPVTPVKGVPSIGARPPATPPKGQPTFAPAAKALDDDAAFDSAFGILEDDLAIPVEPKPEDASSSRPTSTPDKPEAPKPGSSFQPSKPTSTPDKSGAPDPSFQPSSSTSAPARAEAPKPAKPEPSKPEASSLEPAVDAAVEAKAAQPTPAKAEAAVEARSRPSSEGALATARASELAMPAKTEDFEQATSTGPVASSHTGPEPALRSRSKLPLLLGVAAAAIGAVVVIVIATRGGGDSKPAQPAQPAATPSKAEVDKHLSAAASRISDGKLVGRGGDAALDHLLAAKALAPTDPRVLAQLKALADTFEKLGDGALAANDLAEAATHYQAAITAEPDRASAKTKLADVENRARGR